MSDHYQTLGLQPNASKTDIKKAYLRLAHRCHPDHHAQGDADGRAAAAAAFRRVKDAYDVLYDDGRRAEYDRVNCRSSSTSDSGYGNRHGQNRSSGFSTQAWEVKMKKKRKAEEEKRKAERAKQAEENDKWWQKWEADMEKMEAQMEAKIEAWLKKMDAEKAEFEAEWKVENEKREAHRKKREAEKMEREKQAAELESARKHVTWARGDTSTERVKQKHKGRDGGASSSLSGEDTPSSMESDSPAWASGHHTWQHGKYGHASTHSTGQEGGSKCSWSDQRLGGFAKARGYHSSAISISTREELDVEMKSPCWRGDDSGYLTVQEWESPLGEQVKQARRDGGLTDWETLENRVARGHARRHGGSAYSSSCGHGNQQGQYSSWGHIGTSSCTASNGLGGTSSSPTASNGHGHGGPRNRPPPWVPRRMVGGNVLTVCCAGVFGGSALLWSVYNKRSARSR